MKTTINLQRKVIQFVTLILVISFTTTTYSQEQRNIIFEEFSEVWCGSCGALAPMISKWLDNHPDYIPIVYYSYFMDGVSQKTISPTDYNFRKTFYGLPFYPYARINAVMAPNSQYPGFPNDTSEINNIIDTMSKITPVHLDIDFINKGKTGKVNVTVTSDESLDNKNLYVFLVEKHHTYIQQSNGQSEFHHIFRKTLPSPSGQEFSISVSETKEFNFDYVLDDNTTYDLFATAVVQDNTTKYIYQAESVFKSPNTSVGEEANDENEIMIFPNPANENLNIYFNSNQFENIEITILDIFGREVRKEITKGKSISIDCVDYNGNSLPAGVYLLKASNKGKIKMVRFIKE